MPTREAQTKTDTVFEVEGRTKLAVFNLSVREHRDADTGFYVWLDVAVAEFVDQNRGERQAVVILVVLAIPVGVGAIPVAGQTADVALQPGFIPIKLHAQTISHGGLAGLTDRKLNTVSLRD